MNVAYRIGIRGVHGDRKELIRKRFLPKCVCLRGALPRTPLGGLQRPQTPSWKRLGYTSIRPIGVNRPAFGGAVPHFHQMSRPYRSVRQVPSKLHARQPSPTTVYFFNAATPASSVNTATVVFTATLEYNTTHSTVLMLSEEAS